MSDATPPKKKSAKESMKSYGRQGEGKTIRSVSLDKRFVSYGVKQAKKRGISFSLWLNELIAKADPEGSSGDSGDQ